VSNHHVRLVLIGDQWQARCSCKQRSPVGDRGDAETWDYMHHQEIERIRAQLGGRTPSLKSQREWFLQQADNEDNPSEDRALWRQLADELEHFLVDRTRPPGEQLALF
jgi:hypothetical protein